MSGTPCNFALRTIKHKIDVFYPPKKKLDTNRSFPTWHFFVSHWLRKSAETRCDLLEKTELVQLKKIGFLLEFLSDCHVSLLFCSEMARFIETGAAHCLYSLVKLNVKLCLCSFNCLRFANLCMFVISALLLLFVYVKHVAILYQHST